ncbi:MAG: ribose 5-phosphate isomerase B [Actinobacteria bacterium]|nr:ribose 5-phosphate isomerase B [Actinomycetota bacterium]
MTKAVGIASDHAGFEYKELIKTWLEEAGYKIKDFGVYDNSRRLDYKAVKSLADGVIAKDVSRGIAICGTGLAVSIVANKVKGIRAAVCNDLYTAKKSREHNDANILAFGSRVIGFGLAQEITETWLKTAFDGGRHEERNKYIDSI